MCKPIFSTGGPLSISTFLRLQRKVFVVYGWKRCFDGILLHMCTQIWDEAVRIFVDYCIGAEEQAIEDEKKKEMNAKECNAKHGGKDKENAEEEGPLVGAGRTVAGGSSGSTSEAGPGNKPGKGVSGKEREVSAAKNSGHQKKVARQKSRVDEVWDDMDRNMVRISLAAVAGQLAQPFTQVSVLRRGENSWFIAQHWEAILGMKEGEGIVQLIF